MNEELSSSVINFMGIPSLRNIALASLVASALEPRQHVGLKIHKTKDFKTMLKNISRKWGTLLPPNLRDKALHYVSSMGTELQDWLRDFLDKARYPFRVKKVRNCIRWTMRGTIDVRRTFEALLTLKNDNNLRDLYNMACDCCLQEHIVELWKEDDEYYGLDRGEKFQSEVYYLIGHWTRSIEDSDDAMYSCTDEETKEILELSIKNGNLIAVEFFWSQLTDDVKSDILESSIQQVVGNILRYHKFGGLLFVKKHIIVLCFLLSQLKHVQQQCEVFKSLELLIVQATFHLWPLQEFLIPTVRLMWDFIDEDAYIDLLSTVMQFIKPHITKRYLLWELWHETPEHLKTIFIQDIKASVNALLGLFAVEDMETVRLIMYHADANERWMIMSYLLDAKEIGRVIFSGKLPLIQIQSLLLESDLIKFKEKLIRMHGNQSFLYWVVHEQWEELDTFLNWCFTSKDRVDCYKKSTMNKLRIAGVLIFKSQYETIDKFIRWCFSCDEDILQFKKEIANCDDIVASLRCNDWKAFLELCFISDDEINEFKKALVSPERMYPILSKIITLKYDFKLADHLLTWCLGCEVETLRFKRQLVLSSEGTDLFEKLVSAFLSRTTLNDLGQWLQPLGEEVLLQLTKNLEEAELESEPLFKLLRDPECYQDVRCSHLNTSSEFSYSSSSDDDDL